MSYYEGEKIHRIINRKDWHKQQFDADGEVIDSRYIGFQQPSDEDEQGNVLTTDELAPTKINESHRTPKKQNAKPAAEPEDQETRPSPEPNWRRLQKQDHETETMKKLFARFTENTQKQLREQEEKHAMEIAAMKWTKHGHTKPSNQKKSTNQNNEWSQNISTFHRDD
jgi:hypothetical protein